jgi:hypothetical protein
VRDNETEFQVQKQKYKLTHKLPLIKFYRNGQTGEDKLTKGYEIMNAKYKDMVEELHEGISHNVKEVTEQILSNIAVSAAQEGKYVLIYYYNDEAVSLHFKAISGLKIFSDDFVFLAYSNPPQ